MAGLALIASGSIVRFESGDRINDGAVLDLSGGKLNVPLTGSSGSSPIGTNRRFIRFKDSSRDLLVPDTRIVLRRLLLKSNVTQTNASETRHVDHD